MSKQNRREPPPPAAPEPPRQPARPGRHQVRTGGGPAPGVSRKPASASNSVKRPAIRSDVIAECLLFSQKTNFLYTSSRSTRRVSSSSSGPGLRFFYLRPLPLSRSLARSPSWSSGDSPAKGRPG
jgi:hypothetical protein